MIRPDFRFRNCVPACLIATWLTVLVSGCDSDQSPILTISSVKDQVLQHPAHVMKIGSRYVATELYTKRLVTATSADFSSPQYIDQASLGATLASPHFLSKATDGGLMVSEGWGSGIVHIADINDRRYTRYQGPKNDRMNAPHGVCVSSDGWIYVADSLNSRLVRFRDMKGRDWQIFGDVNRRIAYGRQLLCRDDGVWLVNSYERREGINPGQGSNILWIQDFSSGKVDEVASFPKTNATGLAVLDDRWLIVGLWLGKNKLIMIDLMGKKEHQYIEKPEGIAGPPYGISVDETGKELYVSFIGDLHNRKNTGGLVTYTIR
jgi:hypothetical protein